MFRNMFHGKRKGQNTVINIEEKVWQGGQEVDQTLAGGILVKEKLEETHIIVHLQQDVTSILHKQGLQQREKVHARVKHILRQRKERMTQVHLNQSIANLILVPLHQDVKSCLCKQSLKQIEKVHARVKHILRKRKESMIKIIANLLHKQDQCLPQDPTQEAKRRTWQSKEL